MDPLRKYEFENEETEGGVGYSFGEMHGATAYSSSKPEGHSLPPAYEDDITREALAQLQADADEFLADGDWVLIDGYAG